MYAQVNLTFEMHHFACLLKYSLKSSALGMAHSILPLAVLLQCQQQLNLHTHCQSTMRASILKQVRTCSPRQGAGVDNYINIIV